MQIQVVVTLRVEGFHGWPEAHDAVDFLRHRHRHIFHIKAWKNVTHADRDVEIILLKRELDRHLSFNYGTPCEFGRMSCEEIATVLLRVHKLAACEVLEDGENGALIK